ncbi:MAG: hypothetical protein H0U65_03565 [Rubrobacter sp.]|jgi:hypothetical protein|nr:hypothetical protein [Rubrobacter sp.]
MSEANERNRGEGSMANALRMRRRGGGVEREPGGRQEAPRRRSRKKIGKRSNPDYMLASALVRKDVYERVRQALLSGDVKQETLMDLAERGVLHQPGKPLYSDVVEMLLKEWLERVGWEVEEG